MAHSKPSRQRSARPPEAAPQPDWTNLRLRDCAGRGLRVLFVGINPGVRSALTGHHFAGYSNRFWKLLHESGLVPVRLTAEDDGRLVEWGFGVTNLIPRASPGIDDLDATDYAAGRVRLFRKIGRWRPEVVALVGVTLYRSLFPPVKSAPPRSVGSSRLPPAVGLRPETIHGARVFVLPNPSGRNANFTYTEMLDAFCSLRRYLNERPN